MDKNQSLIIGVDVGGTNTDAVIINHKGEVVTWSKCSTTDDVTSGVVHAIDDCIAKAEDKLGDNKVKQSIRRVNIGTTHFINAVLQRQSLAKVAIIRLCLPASVDVPPFTGKGCYINLHLRIVAN